MAAPWYVKFPYHIRFEVDHANVDGPLSDFPLYHNGSNLPDHFWEHTLPSGNDVRFGTVDGIQLPAEMVSFDKSNGAMECHFKAFNLPSESNLDIIIFYGNPDASALPLETQLDVWSNGYTHVYHNNDLTTTKIRDSCDIQELNKTSVPDSTEIDGKIGKAQYFVTRSIMGTANVDLLYPTEWCASAWVIPHNAAANAGFICRGSGGTTGSGFNVCQSTNNPPSIYYWMYDKDGVLRTSTTSDITRLPFEEWSYFVAQYDSISKQMQCSVNGSTFSTRSVDGFIQGDTHVLRLHSEFQLSAPSIDEVRTASIHRELEWIKTEYNNQNSPSTFYTNYSRVYETQGRGSII